MILIWCIIIQNVMYRKWNIDLSSHEKTFKVFSSFTHTSASMLLKDDTEQIWHLKITFYKEIKHCMSRDTFEFKSGVCFWHEAICISSGLIWAARLIGNAFNSLTGKRSVEGAGSGGVGGLWVAEDAGVWCGGCVCGGVGVGVGGGVWGVWRCVFS